MHQRQRRQTAKSNGGPTQAETQREIRLILSTRTQPNARLLLVTYWRFAIQSTQFPSDAHTQTMACWSCPRSGTWKKVRLFPWIGFEVLAKVHPNITCDTTFQNTSCIFPNCCTYYCGRVYWGWLVLRLALFYVSKSFFGSVVSFLHRFRVNSQSLICQGIYANIQRIKWIFFPCIWCAACLFPV